VPPISATSRLLMADSSRMGPHNKISNNMVSDAAIIKDLVANDSFQIT
jgi:hypothetical protein